MGFFNFGQKIEQGDNKIELADKAIDTGFSSNKEELKSRLEENKKFFTEKQ